MVKQWIASGQLSSVLLLVATILSLGLANSPVGEQWHGFWEIPLSLQIKETVLQTSLHAVINDGLMAIFFLMVGLEIKRELLGGELSSWRKASLPVGAAIGGMLVPALLYSIIDFGKPTAVGWAIPMATDIALALGVLGVLGKRVPISLKVLLLALAIIDDLGAIVVIALFYGDPIVPTALGYAGLVWGILLACNYFGVKSLRYYLPLGLVLWFFIQQSGIHSTVAGVLTAIAIPHRRHHSYSSLLRLEHALHAPVSYVIMPLFVLANTAMIISGDWLASFSKPLGIGIMVGLVLGKPIGIFGFSYALLRLGWAQMPANLRLVHLLGLGCIAGIGFTMSVFIATLSFTEESTLVEAKLAILVGSLISALAGVGLIGQFSKPSDKEEDAA